MSEFKYPLFSPRLMQVNSFAYTSPTYQHPFRDKWTVGAVSFALDDPDELVQNEQQQNVFLKRFDQFMQDNGLTGADE